jgi:hypothetical protein
VWDVTLPFWVIMHSGCWNVMNHIASRGTIFGRSFVGVRGFFFTMSHTATRASWPYMDFWTFIKYFVTSVLGLGYTPIWEMCVCMALYGNAATPQVFRVHKMSPSLLLSWLSVHSHVCLDNMRFKAIFRKLMYHRKDLSIGSRDQKWTNILNHG